MISLQRNGLTHGFLLPENILLYSNNNQILYKLLDVELISRIPNSYERMILESDYFAPLDPELLHFLSNLESDIHYKSAYDIW